MRKIIVVNIASLDGYYEGPINGVMDLPMDEAFDSYNLERISAADTVLLGATSYRLFNGFWPAMAQHPQASRTEQAFSRRYDEVDVVVVSSSLEVASDAPWAPRTTVVAPDQVAALKETDGKDIVVFGSRTMWHGLLNRGLVDEVHLMQGPAALCGGTALFDTPVALHLQDTRTFEGSDNVLLAYTVH